MRLKNVMSSGTKKMKWSVQVLCPFFKLGCLSPWSGFVKWRQLYLNNNNQSINQSVNLKRKEKKMKWSFEYLTNLPQIDILYLHAYEKKSSGIEECKKEIMKLCRNLLRKK